MCLGQCLRPLAEELDTRMTAVPYGMSKLFSKRHTSAPEQPTGIPQNCSQGFDWPFFAQMTQLGPVKIS